MDYRHRQPIGRKLHSNMQFFYYVYLHIVFETQITILYKYYYTTVWLNSLFCLVS